MYNIITEESSFVKSYCGKIFNDFTNLLIYIGIDVNKYSFLCNIQ